mgnify:CR=1 FL=1
MTNQSKLVWEAVTVLQKFQFPWRLLSVVVFTTSVLGGLLISIAPRKKQFIFFSLLLIALLFLNKDYWHAKNYLLKEENFYKEVYYGTTDTGESSPIWSIRFMEKEPNAHSEVISGRAILREVGRTSANHKYEIITEEKSRIRENTLYFPGWHVLVDGKTTDIEFQDPANRGLITFFVDKGEHFVEIQFKETKLRSIANITSFLSCLLMVFGILLWKKKIDL